MSFSMACETVHTFWDDDVHYNRQNNEYESSEDEEGEYETSEDEEEKE